MIDSLDADMSLSPSMFIEQKKPHPFIALSHVLGGGGRYHRGGGISYVPRGEGRDQRLLYIHSPNFISIYK